MSTATERENKITLLLKVKAQYGRALMKRLTLDAQYRTFALVMQDPNNERKCKLPQYYQISPVFVYTLRTPSTLPLRAFLFKQIGVLLKHIFKYSTEYPSLVEREQNLKMPEIYLKFNKGTLKGILSQSISLQHMI